VTKKIYWHHEPKTDVPMMWFTFVAAFAALASGWIFYLQLKEMQRSATLDQRAWLKVVIKDWEISEGHPISAHLLVSNIGKTPARVIKGDVVIELLGKDDSPNFKSPVDGSGLLNFTTGIMFPSSSDPDGVLVQQPTRDAQLSHDDFVHLKNGDQYATIQGNLRFLDIFGAQHWLHFCTWKSIASPGHNFQTRSCIEDYNDTDHD
jgi:hypothetical protein